MTPSPTPAVSPAPPCDPFAQGLPRPIKRVVSVSGGKDSTACALLALERHPADEIALVFADTGNEHDLTYRYVNEYMPEFLGVPVHVVRSDFTSQIAHKAEYIREHWAEKGVPQAKIGRALAILKPTGNPFLDLCLWKGRFPSRMTQFCTQELKQRPLESFHLGFVEQGYVVHSWQGVRRDESQNRRDACEMEDLGGIGIYAYRPILDWTAQQVVDYVRGKGMELNPLYRHGMKRVGCFPCINCGKNEIMEISRRYPEHIERIAEWERLVSEASKRGAGTFFCIKMDGSPQEIFDAGNIRQVVEWSKTARGGKQYEIFKSHESAPVCSSAYGLCE